jgi:hypothetical protein
MESNTSKYLVIPLTDNRDIKIKFNKVNDHQWQCITSDEVLIDIEDFFGNGYYKLDPERQISVSKDV